MPRGVRWALMLGAPLAGINLMVALCGHSVVFPLSPFHLRDKLIALGKYARHRPGCLLVGHPPIAPLVARAEARYRLPRGFLAAVVEVESEGRVHRISPAGAMGPGQLAPATARALGVEDPFDPEENLGGSARYLAIQLHAFHDLRLAAAAYNAGPGAVVNRAIPHNGQTEVYVVRVMRALAEQRRVKRR